ncbi:ABC transporter permease [bacterium]|nr:ABC transporter permease [bacterium]
MKNSPLANLLAMHFREFFREPEILFWTMGFPIILALILGLAFVRKDITPQHIGVIISANSETPAPFQTWMDIIKKTDKNKKTAPEQTDTLPPIVFKHYTSFDDALTGIKRGDILLFIRYDRETQSRVYSFDPQKSDARLMYHLLEKADNSGVKPLSHRTKHLKAIGSRYIDFLIPGLIAFGILQSCMWAIGWSLIDRRIKKMLRRMVATPMNRYTYLLSYLISRLLLSAIEISVLLLFAMLAFKIRIEGSLLALFLLFLCGNFAFAGIAVLTASRAKNAQVGNGLINAVTLPMMILSGIFFSYKTFPEWAIPVIEMLPLTMLADATRRVFIEGAGIPEIILPSLALTATGTLCLLVSQKIFRWY